MNFNFILIVIYIIFTLGCFVFLKTDYCLLKNIKKARMWVKVPAKIVFIDIIEIGNGMLRFKAEVLYEYNIKSATHYCSNIYFGYKASMIPSFHKRLLDKLPTVAELYVNTDNVAESVVFPEISAQLKWEIVAHVSIFLFINILFVCYMLSI